MKKFIALGLILAIFSCNKEPKIEYVSLSGKIENPTDKIVTIYKDREKVKEISLDENGTFADTLKIEDGYYTLSHGRENSAIYLSSGDDIKMSLNTKEFDETITYSGKGSENNNFLAAKYLAEEKTDFDFAKVFSMKEADFLATMDEVKSTKLEQLKSAKNITEEFRTLENKNVEYDHFSNLQSYQSAHKYFTKNDDFKPSEGFMKTLETVDYNNKEDYSLLGSYKRLVQSYYSNKISNSDNPSEIFEELDKNAFPALKEDLANNLRYNIAPNNEHNQAYYDGVMALSADDKFKEEITAKYTKVKKLAKGMPSPEFIEYENHKGGTTSLEDLKGQYVYVDVWATWCGPCIREIPSLKEVEKQFHGKNIAFVSTSIDKAKDHSTWVEMVKKKELGGTQLMADNDWSSQFVKDYAIEGIPRFILIDPSGNIVSADAPRPSSPKLIELFKELKI